MNPSRPDPDSWEWSGELLRVRGGGVVRGSACLLCGSPQALPTARHFDAAPFLALARRRVTVTLPLCARCVRRWDRSRRVYDVLWAAGFPAFSIGGGLWAGRYGGGPTADLVGAVLGVALGFLSWLAIFVGYRVVWALRRQVFCVYARDGWVWLRLPQPAVARRVLEGHPSDA